MRWTDLFRSFAVHERVPVRADNFCSSFPFLFMIVSFPKDIALYVIAFLAPLLLQWIINLATIRNWWDAHNSALGRKTQIL